MKFFSQVDPERKNTNIGNTQYKIGRYGCFITSIGMLLEVEPNEIASHPEFFNSDGTIKSSETITQFYGGGKDPDNTKQSRNPTIIETEFDGSRHFIVKYNGQIYDPLSLDGHPLRTYTFESYRNIWKGADMGLGLDYIKDHLWKYKDISEVNISVDNPNIFDNDWARVVERPLPENPVQASEIDRLTGIDDELSAKLKESNNYIGKLTGDVTDYQKRLVVKEKELDETKSINEIQNKEIANLNDTIVGLKEELVLGEKKSWWDRLLNWFANLRRK